MEQEIVFVVGVERSGTTWLWRSLASHPEILGVPETHLFALGAEVDAASRERFRATPFWISFERPDDPIEQISASWRELADTNGVKRRLEQRLASATRWDEVASHLFAELSGRRRLLVEKTPGHTFAMAEIKRRFPKAKFIGIVRDGRDVLASLRALGRPWTDRWRDLDAAALRWGQGCTQLLQARTSWPADVLLIQYEELLAGFTPTFTRVLDFLGAARDRELVERIAAANTFEAYSRRRNGDERPGDFHRSGVAGSFRRDLSPAEVAHYEARVGPVLSLFGYPLAAAEPSAAAESTSTHSIADYLDLFRGHDLNRGEYYRVHRTRYAQTLALVPPARPGERLLELGAAFHHMTPYLAERLGYKVHCHDLLAEGDAPRHVIESEDRTRRIEVPVASFDLERDRFPYPDAHFAAVVCCEILEHLNVDPMGMLLEIRRVLKDDGVLILTTPNVSCTESLLALIEGRSPYVYGKFERSGRPADRHNREWTPGEVSRLLACAGFATEKLITASSWFPTRPALVELLRQLKADTRLRDDNILVVARRRGAPAERWPEEFYLATGVQSEWRDAAKSAGGVRPEATIAASAGAPSRRFLVVHDYPPQFDASGADLRLLDLLEALRRRGDRVTFVGRFGARQPAHRVRLEQLGIELLAPDRERARFIEELDVPPLDLKRLLAERRFDAALLTHWYWCGVSVAEHYLDLVRRDAPATKVIVLSDDVHWLREERRAARSGRRADLERARAMRVRDRDVARRADLLLAITADDAARLAEEAGDTPVAIVRHCSDVAAQVPSFRERAGLCFVGTGLNDANNTGIEWFLREVWPLVRARAPQAGFTIVGRPPALGWSGGLPVAGVDAVGQVDRLEPFLSRACVFVSPLLFGTGLKTKNVHALAHGVPLVTTTIGAEGMGFDDPLAADVHDDPRRFAESVARLLEDEAHWSRRSRAGLELARRRFSRTGLDADLEAALQRLEVPRASAPLAAPLAVLAVERREPAILTTTNVPRLLARANAHVRLANEQIAAGRFEDALLELRSIAVEVQGSADWWGFAPVFESLALVYGELERPDEAIASLAEARRLRALRRPAPAAAAPANAIEAAPA